MIRPAKASDADSIAKVIVDAWQEAYCGIIDPDYPGNLRLEKYAAIFKEIIQKQTEWVHVYEIENTLVGFVSEKPHEGKYDSEVKGLYILPDYQGKGIGTSLLSYAKEFLRSSGFTKLIIWTLLGASNNQFYEANGGVGLENKILKIGSKEYKGIGYCFDLENGNKT